MLTYRRPEPLARVLPLLTEQAASIAPPARVIVVDNDPAGGARELVEAAGAQYVHEPRPGISVARNRALDAAGGARLIAFIDDDEVPAPHWLVQLVESWQRWRCTAVAGPVDATFARPPSPWLAATGVFDRRAHQTGDRVRGAATHNLLLDLAEIRRLGLSFDERLGLTGGEDTMFSHSLISRGGDIRWCDEAAVVEHVTEDRLSRRWVLRRSYRAGTSWSRTELTLANTAPRRSWRRASLVVRGTANLARGACVLLVGLARRDVTLQARGAVTIASYAGLLAGSFGATLREYRRAGGDAS